jgi:hypothetical protein
VLANGRLAGRWVVRFAGCAGKRSSGGALGGAFSRLCWQTVVWRGTHSRRIQSAMREQL